MQKTIKINPDLFTVNKNNKSDKSKTVKNTKVNSYSSNIQTNRVKQKLLERVKEYQKNKQSNKNKEHLDELNNFEDSLNFLQNLSSNYEKKLHDNPNYLNKSMKIRKSDNYNIKLELPKELNNIEKINLDPNSTKTYGCLKNGKLPTYREWKRQTQKNNIDPKENFKLKINTDINTYSDTISEREYKLNEMKKKFQEGNKPLSISMNPPDIPSVTPQVIPLVTQPASFPVTQSVIPPPNPLTKILSTPLTPVNAPISIDSSLTSQNISTSTDISTDTNIGNINAVLGSLSLTENPPEEQKETDTNNKLSGLTELTDLTELKLKNVPKIHRHIKTYKYKLGKSKKTNSIAIFIKNRNTLKNIKRDFCKLKNVEIMEVKKYLREHNLIKIGTNAPNDVLRELYEKAVLSGNVNNKNKSNMIHNFINE